MGTGLHRLTIEEGGSALTKRIREGKVFIAGKLGTSEFDALNGNPFALPLHKKMFVNAGLFGSTGQKPSDVITEWSKYMHDNIDFLDEMVLWNPIQPIAEEIFAKSYVKNVKRIQIQRIMKNKNNYNKK